MSSNTIRKKGSITLNPKLHLNPDEEKRWSEIRLFRYSHPSSEGQVVSLFWRNTVEAYTKEHFICASILAGVTAELAHKVKLRKQGAEMKRTDGRSKSWGKLIIQYEKNAEMKQIAIKIKDEYRNIWVHPNYEGLVSYLKKKGGPITTDPEMNVAFASAKALELLYLTCQFLKRLLGGYLSSN